MGGSFEPFFPDPPPPPGGGSCDGSPRERERGGELGGRGPPTYVPRDDRHDAPASRANPVQCRFAAGRSSGCHFWGVGDRSPPPPPSPGRPAYAQPLSPQRQVPASMVFVTDSNRPQPLWQPPPTACLTASEVLSLLMHPCPLPPTTLLPTSQGQSEKHVGKRSCQTGPWLCPPSPRASPGSPDCPPIPLPRPLGSRRTRVGIASPAITAAERQARKDSSTRVPRQHSMLESEKPKAKPEKRDRRSTFAGGSLRPCGKRTSHFAGGVRNRGGLAWQSP